MNSIARKAIKNLICDDLEIDYRIKTGIEENRKGFARIELVYDDGKPVENAEIYYKMIKHEYRFGCNAFMIKEFEEEEKNAEYEKSFAKLFNHAVVPFFWDSTEPEKGQYRFSSDSKPMYRRPSIDTILEFCDKYGISPKGHCLIWQALAPSWVPTDRLEMEYCIEERIRVIAECYGDKIKVWDVCNEALQWNPFVHDIALPEEHMEKAFKMVGKYFPESSEMIYNEGPWVSWNNFHGDYTSPYMLARHLKLSGLPIGGMGLQYHMAFYGDNFQKLMDWSSQFSNQRYLFAHLDQYAKLDLPLNISEITIPSQPELGDGEHFQELVTERLFKIWFSHQATNGITWWNLVDGTAYVAPQDFNNNQDENQYCGGLLNNDMSTKAAYRMLDRLINGEWKSSGILRYQSAKANMFRGFYGQYELKIKTESGEYSREISVSKYSDNKLRIIIASQ